MRAEVISLRRVNKEGLETHKSSTRAVESLTSQLFESANEKASLVGELEVLKAEHKSLSSQHDTLKAEHKSLSSQHDDLRAKYESAQLKELTDSKPSETIDDGEDLESA